MKITLYTWEDQDNQTHEEMHIDGKRRMSVHPLYECPEDAIIGRDLVSCSEVIEHIKEALEAGRNGEDFQLTIIEKDPDEEDGD